MSQGLILYGPPAAGKDTITAALSAEDPHIRLFERLKAGPGRRTGYRMTTPEQLDSLSRSGGIIWENSRYGARYAIDRPTLMDMMAAGLIPIIHAGQPEVISAVQSATPDDEWVIVALTCSRETALSRIVRRNTGDTAERMAVWDRTPALQNAHLTVSTDHITPEQAALHIRALIAPHQH